MGYAFDKLWIDHFTLLSINACIVTRTLLRNGFLVVGRIAIMAHDLNFVCPLNIVHGIGESCLESVCLQRPDCVEEEKALRAM